MASFVYNRAAKEIMDGTINLLTDTIKAMLVTSVYVADRDHDFVDAGGASDPVDAELSGTGYVAGYAGAGRKTLAGKTITESDATDRAIFDANDLVWAAINAGTAAAVIIFKNGSADDTTSKLIAYIDSGGFPKVTNGGDLTVTWNAAGVVQLTT